eukprot:TRINITY_DN2177_c0_g1_i1.p1 TRINITY_DN2177_c0_g1~~TRINITY_DN2177_c0_g1_i1.p1  ORF type:complete len:659 (-),score=152.75 TRINITY_DN2177_c0_g1_i1:141-2000(-)
MQETSQAPSNASLSDSRGGRPWESNKSSQPGGFRSGGVSATASGEYGRSWSNNNNSNMNSSGGVSKWNDRSVGSSATGNSSQYQYGEDGLCPPNPRLESELFGDHRTTGINFEKYNDLKVEREGVDIPDCLESFLDSDLGPVLNHNVRLLGYSVPTPVQKNAIPIVMSGRDLMACAQTGSGKTAGFLFPVIADLVRTNAPDGRQVSSGAGYRRSYKIFPSALVLAPTRELAVQIHKEASKFTYRSHLKCVVVYGGAEFRTQLAELERGCHILVATPGRLIDMMERGKVGISQIKYLCIDEADRMLDMGFEQQIRGIVDECPAKGTRQTLMFSATFPKTILRLAEDFLHNYILVSVGRRGSATDIIKQNVRWVDDHEKKPALLDLLSTVDGLTLVFTETKRMADHLEEFLYNNGFSAASIHGDRSQREREAALDAFKKGHAQILVATDVAARGLDVSNVKHVINYDLPTDVDDYVHRIGRTGRAGNEGLATAFFNDKNRNLSRDLVDILDECGQEVEPWLLDIANQYSQRGTRNTGRGGRGGRRGGGSTGGSGGFSRGGPSAASAKPAPYNYNGGNSGGGYYYSGATGGGSYGASTGAGAGAGSTGASSGGNYSGGDSWW